MTEPALQRCFIAIPIPQPLQQQITALQQLLRQKIPELKTPNTETLHLTLHFLGDQPQEQLAKIERLMLSVGQNKKDFNVLLEGLGCFPNRRRPRTLWLGLHPETELVQLQQQLAQGLTDLGFTIDQRRYRPHLTIGRLRQPPADGNRLCPFLSHSCGSLKIDRMVLYTSKLAPQGAIHTPVATALLGNRPNTNTEHNLATIN